MSGEPQFGPETATALAMATSSLGIVMLVHNAFNRAEQAARHWAASGCPVVIHVDRNVANSKYNALVESLADEPLVMFSTRHRC